MKLDKYVGIPYVRGGASFAGADCYGIVQLYYRNEMGVELPRPVEYAEPMQRLRHALDGYRAAGFDMALDDRRAGDVVMLEHGGVPDTFAVVLADGRIMTTSRTTGSVIAKLDARRVAATFRHGDVKC